MVLQLAELVSAALEMKWQRDDSIQARNSVKGQILPTGYSAG
jgi:hypothetical protein